MLLKLIGFDDYLLLQCCVEFGFVVDIGCDVIVVCDQLILMCGGVWQCELVVDLFGKIMVDDCIDYCLCCVYC